MLTSPARWSRACCAASSPVMTMLCPGRTVWTEGRMERRRVRLEANWPQLLPGYHEIRPCSVLNTNSSEQSAG